MRDGRGGRGPGGENVTTAQLARRLKLDVSAVGRRVNVAIAAGYLRNDEDKRNKPRRLATADPLPDDEELLPTLDDWLCSCATPSEGTDTPTDIDDNDLADLSLSALREHFTGEPW